MDEAIENPSNPTADRKVQHIAIIREDDGVDRRKFYFDDIRLTHRALPEIALRDVDPSINFLGKKLSFPLLISCMTGGSHERVRRINRNLAAAAEAEQVAMGVGSQRVMFGSNDARSSFALRDAAPTVPLLGNLGAVQLNEGFGVEHAREAVSVLAADALVFHLNPLQEAVQPEGDTNFTGLAEKIGAVVRALAPTPVIVKEVGAGISLADARLLTAQGIRYIDVAGSGGTSWSRIEHHRQDAGPDQHDVGLVFQDWGIPTPLALRNLGSLRPDTTLIASGGIRSGLDMVKSVVLGASLAGLAKPFLEPALESVEAVRDVIRRLRREFTTAMFLLGAGNIHDVHGREDLICSRPWK
ncbi:MAG TPA: type 2 isopentenyl-diphosphate Delta-isomerase [Kiritimatiellia bacterium]|nr:type 2 isopentenyl-diphosphate Delta-isomerase [Kiritimatiellia bacterium]HMO99160.1 type 2 isopentenyl-diphosphate Delta-isomerase [Kiritimatiellia bacterium]HMP95662.1 type 2 isopentenyl-diphosphate Delta-isomerase [Kiritimatiellia bacterium]